MSKLSKYTELRDKNWLKQKYEVEKLSTVQIANLVGSTPGNVASHLKHAGISSRSSKDGLRARFPEGRFGEQAARWTGGKTIVNNYVAIYAPEHPRGGTTKRVFEHILVAEKTLGRYLEKDEVVHHINGDKQDNRPENLEVCKRSEHVHHHFTAGKGIQELHKRIEYLEGLLRDNDVIFS